MTPTQRRVLVALAELESERGLPVKARELGGPVALNVSWVCTQLGYLARAGFVEKTPAGYRLAPGVIVGRAGTVGRVVRTWA